MERSLKKRTANKNVVQKLVVEINEMIGDKSKRKEIDRMIRNIEVKMSAITGLNEEILDGIEADQMEVDMELAARFEIEVMKEMDRFKEFLVEADKAESNVAPSTDKETVPVALIKTEEAALPISEAATHQISQVDLEHRDGVVRNASEAVVQSVVETGTQPVYSVAKSGVKLPKIIIKKFDGDPVQWQQFVDTFDATITKNDALSEIEKFTYLRGYLAGEAEKCIEGIPLTSENFGRALNLLRERYGNPQLIISSHMDKLIKLERVSGFQASIKELRNLHDKIESHLRSLLTLGVNSEHYGPMLMPIIVSKLPNDIRLEISRKLGTDNWKISEFMEILKIEITARENCDYVHSQTQRDRAGRDANNGERRERKITTQTLLAATSTRIPKCCFCKQNHYNDKCNVVTDIASRKKIAFENKLCWKCLTPNHVKKDCRSRRNCYTCKSPHHHTAICEKEAKKADNNSSIKITSEETQVTYVNAKQSVLLQTAYSVISDVKENRSRRIRILLDPGSQKTYVSQGIVDALQLEAVSEEI